MIKLPSLKKRKPIVYISLALYVLLIVFIMVEASLPSGISGLQSMLFADFSALFVNTISGPKIPKEISPSSIISTSDSSYLGKDENDESLIAIGTTTLFTLNVEYPKKDNSYDVYKQTYDLSYVSGNKEDYDVILSSMAKNNTFSIYLRVVAKNISSDKYQININVADTLNYEYKFHIIETAAPTNYESKIDKTVLKIGESASITTKLIDEKRNDYYLRRYLDVSKIERSSSNKSVATIDEFGVVHAHSTGTAIITFGKYDFEISVTSENIQNPVGNALNLIISDSSKDSLSLLDYDYVFEENEDPNAYSVLVYSDFLNDELEDQNVTWSVSDKLMAMIAPYAYDEDGYPIYKDELNRNCVRVCGYRKEGILTLSCFSNANPEIKKDLEINVVEAEPNEMTINVNGSPSIYINNQIVINANFSPKNVNNKNLFVETNNPDVIDILNNNTNSVVIKGIKVGKAHIKVTSLKNNALIKEFDISVDAKQAINDENYTEFHTTIRKFIGHFSLFLVTSIPGFLFFYSYLDDKKKWWIAVLISLVMGFAIAGFSELIQLYTISRAATWTDVIIDYIGYVVGIILTLAVTLLIDFIIKKRKNIKQNS